MAAREVFKMTNPHWQGDQQGICTCISLLWAKKVLSLGKNIGSYAQLDWTDHLINGVMASLRKLDNDPVKQSALVDLKPVGGDVACNNVATMVAAVQKTVPHVAIFWNSFHTMGLSVLPGAKQGTTDFDYFDNNIGLYTATSAADIQTKITQSFAANNYGALVGYRLVTKK